MNTSRNIFELLRDERDIYDLLDAYGEAVPEDPQDTRKQLIHLVEELGHTQLITTLFKHASDFAFMCRDIFDLCAEVGCGISGQIQVKTEGVFLKETELNAGWAFTGRTIRDPRIQERMNALAGELLGLASQLVPQRFVRRVHKRVKSQLTRELEESPYPEHQIAAEILNDEEIQSYDAFMEEDCAALKSLCAELGQTQAFLSRAPLTSAVLAAFSELEARCNGLVQQMEPNLSHGAASAEVTRLADEIQVVAAQVYSLAEEMADAERVERGFADFLKTDFWFERWRIYELWLLVQILRALQEAGGQIQLERVETGVWMLKYGKAKEPVARCTFPEGVLEVYYQLSKKRPKAYTAEIHEKSRRILKDQYKAKEADMPDIAVLIPNNGAVFVLDPKHGRSYSKSKVEQVLESYASNPELRPDLTAIVNYFFMDDYPPDKLHKPRQGNQRVLLTSEVCPNGRGLPLLELEFADVLRKRGYGVQSRPEEKSKMRPDRSPARTPYLLYWANEDREVDEPRGFWALPEQGGPTHLEGLTKLIREKPKAINASADGNACVLVEDNKLILLREKEAAETLEGLEGGIEGLAWNPPGKRYAFLSRLHRRVQVIDLGGKKCADVPFPEDQPYATFDWAPGESLFCAVPAFGEKPVTVYHLLDFQEWVQIGECRGSSYSSSCEIRWMGPQDGPVLFCGGGTFRLRPEGIAEVKMEGVLAASPSGLYRINRGPRSLRWKEGVSLLAVEKYKGEPAQLPHLRLFGEVQGEIGWSPGETRVAFLTRPHSEHGRRTGPREDRLFMARIGDRYAFPVSLPGQEPTHFAWVSHSLLKRFLAEKT